MEVFVIYPLKLKPVFKDYLWGGYKLHNDFKMECDYDKIAEAWLLSCHEDGLCTIDNGKYKGILLSEFLKNNPELSGCNCPDDKFPVLIKLIDAHDNLSVQVHPTEKDCKNEMWYVIDCEENSHILYGLKKDISEDEFLMHIKNDTFIDIMNVVPVKKGDVFYIKAGTLHAICSGILIAEIQQSSNVTYRIFDYNRKDADGNPRPLHINDALKVMDFHKSSEIYHKTQTIGNMKILNDCEFFKVCELDINDSEIIHADKSSFVSIIIIDGEGTVQNCSEINAECFKKGDSFFLSAGYDYKIKGKSKIILTKVQV